ncbi:hypothetical protein C810_04209 [Lachnospiraceae bacterium A2]|nr:hypothetical protein C810_04209 [Lachnospiraceae bacterium A2]MCI8706962.1 hypothetical protein [Lachnospiraceae bacterium]
MFGYIIVNKPELKFKEFDLYQSYYCGLCKTLKDQFGRKGQLTLSYDMAFVVLLLTSLYEPETEAGSRKCLAHPFVEHPTRINRFTRYGADMNLLLSYYKCLDDWEDERKVTKKALASSLKKKCRGIAGAYPGKAAVFQKNLKEIRRCEMENCRDMDEVSGYFGEMMGEVFAWKKDEWEPDLRRMGFFMGKFIYLMDGYEDVEKDQKTGNYNLFLNDFGTEGFEGKAERILSMMMAECSRAFERLPIVENTEILRNILYSGVWCRYEYVKKNRERKVTDV